MFIPNNFGYSLLLFTVLVILAGAVFFIGARLFVEWLSARPYMSKLSEERLYVFAFIYVQVCRWWLSFLLAYVALALCVEAASLIWLVNQISHFYDCREIVHAGVH